MVTNITVTVDSREMDDVTPVGGTLTATPVDPSTGAVIGVVKHTSGNVVLTGSLRTAIPSTGTGAGTASMLLPDPASTGLDPTGYAYRFTLQPYGAGPVTATSDLSEAVGGTIAFSQLVTASPTAPSYATQTNTAKQYADAAAQSAAAAAASATTAQQYATSIAVDPNDPNVLEITYAQYATSIAVDPNDPNVLEIT